MTQRKHSFITFNRLLWKETCSDNPKQVANKHKLGRLSCLRQRVG